MLNSGVFAFRDFLNTSIPEILKSKNLSNESPYKHPNYYYFEILVLKLLKIFGTQTPRKLTQILPHYD